jgi:hypothetical protein
MPTDLQKPLVFGSPSWIRTSDTRINSPLPDRVRARFEAGLIYGESPNRTLKTSYCRLAITEAFGAGQGGRLDPCDPRATMCRHPPDPPMYECSKELAATLKFCPLMDGLTVMNGTFSERMRLSNVWIAEMDRHTDAWRYAVQHACGLQNGSAPESLVALERAMADHGAFVREKVEAILAMRRERDLLYPPKGSIDDSHQAQ